VVGVSSRRRTRLLSVVCGSLALGSLGACSSGSDTTAPTGTTSSSSSAVVTTAQPTPPRSIEVGTTITFPTADPTAVAVFAGLAEVLPMSDEERSCAAARLAADPALLDRVRSGAAPNTPEFGLLTEIMIRCRQAATFGEQFAVNLSDQFPDLSAEQLACLKEGFGALSPAELDLLMAAGLDPAGSSVSSGVRVMSDLLSRCGVSS